jgi:uncharacterized membrane protein HdeD (DUF308 family)
MNSNSISIENCAETTGGKAHAASRSKRLIMRFALAHNWWSLVVRGIVAVLFAAITFIWPGITFAALVFVFAAYALVDGIMSLMGAVRAERAHGRWGALVFEGVVGIGAAILTVFWPAITALALVYIVAFWAIFTGIAEIFAAVRLRRHISGEWLLAIAGVLSIAFGCLLVAAPLAGAIVLALWAGVYMLIFGIVLIALGFRLRAWRRGPLGYPPTAMAPVR